MAGIDLEEMPKKNEAKEFSHTPFQVGELVAHPVHGLWRIQKIETTNIGEGRRLYYIFLVGTSRVRTKVFVPAAEASRSGMRYPITRVQAQSVLQILEAARDDSDLSQRDCLEQISVSLHTGDLFRLAELVRSACFKGASFFGGDFEEGYSDSYRRDQALLTRAVQRLANELSFVLRESPSAMRKRICKKWIKKNSHRQSFYG